MLRGEFKEGKEGHLHERFHEEELQSLRGVKSDYGKFKRAFGEFRRMFGV